MTYKGRAPFPSAAFVESQRNFTYFDKSLSSGLSDVLIESPGDFLYIDQASTGYVYIELNQRQSGTLAPILLAAGGSIECDFASVKLYAPAQLNKSVRIVIGNGARIKGGANVNASSMSVSVVDGGLLRTQAGQAFGGNANCGAVVGQYGTTQLWNPIGSGKNVIVSTFSVSAGAASQIYSGLYATALTFQSAANYYQNKLFGGAAPAAQSRYMNDAAGMKISTFLDISFIAANTPYLCALREPIVIPPGYGLSVATGTLNLAINTNFQWIEQ